MKEKKASQESQSRTMLYIQMINKYMKFKLMFVFVTWGWFTSGPTPNYQWSTTPPSYIYGAPMVVLQRWANRGSADTPTVGQQRTYRWCTVGPTVGQRWVHRGLPVASHRWPNSALIVGVPLGHPVGPTVASHRWANRGPPVASHRWPNGGPTEAHRWLATGGPTEARRTRPQWATGGCHRWPISTRTVGPPLAHQSNAIWVNERQHLLQTKVCSSSV